MFHLPLARSVSSVAAICFLSGGTALASPQLPPVGPLPAVSQRPSSPFTVTGQVRRVGSLRPVPNATVIVEGTTVQSVTDAEGRFTLSGVPPSADHIIIAAPGLMPLRAELVFTGSGAAPLDAVLDAEVHYTEVVSVSPEARDLFASYQPTSVLAGQDLTDRKSTRLNSSHGYIS